jgi:thymidylate kinase
MRAANEPNRFAIIDASQSLVAVKSQVETAVEELLKKQIK